MSGGFFPSCGSQAGHPRNGFYEEANEMLALLTSVEEEHRRGFESDFMKIKIDMICRAIVPQLEDANRKLKAKKVAAFDLGLRVLERKSQCEAAQLLSRAFANKEVTRIAVETAFARSAAPSQDPVQRQYDSQLREVAKILGGTAKTVEERIDTFCNDCISNQGVDFGLDAIVLKLAELPVPVDSLALPLLPKVVARNSSTDHAIPVAGTLKRDGSKEPLSPLVRLVCKIVEAIFDTIATFVMAVRDATVDILFHKVLGTSYEVLRKLSLLLISI